MASFAPANWPSGEFETASFIATGTTLTFLWPNLRVTNLKRRHEKKKTFMLRVG